MASWQAFVLAGAAVGCHASGNIAAVSDVPEGDSGIASSADVHTRTDVPVTPTDTAVNHTDATTQADTAPPPAPVCTAAAGGGNATTAAPPLLVTLADHDEESWMESPAVADLDGDGTPEIVIARDGRLVVWHANGSVVWSVDVSSSRIWASPLVGDFVGDADLEVVVAAGAQVFMYSATGSSIAGFPVAWQDEVRGIAGGDLDGDGHPEIVAVTTNPISAGGQVDLIQAFHGDGSVVHGFPPNTTGTSGCDGTCDVTGGFDQNIALGPLGSDATVDILAPMDDAYMSWHKGSGVAFQVSNIFMGVTRSPALRMFLDYPTAMVGYAMDEATSLQAHFTNTAPAIADIDGDGTHELVVVSSVQNAAQTRLQLGVALWVLNADGTRPGPWTSPFYVPAYLSGLTDFGDTNIVALTNQVSVADLLPSPGLEMVFAGFDGKIHCVGADRTELWNYTYTTAADVVTPGMLIADLSGDGRPEVIFATYSTAMGVSALHVLDANGGLQQRIPLPDRGAMAVPTVADVNGDGTLEVVVSLKDGVDGVRAALVYSFPGSSTNCLPWPTGRGNLMRTGFVPP